MADQTPDELDLSGMDLRGARDYVLAYVKTLKETELRTGKLAADLRLWTERATLARAHGRAELAAAADVRTAALHDELAAAEAEQTTLRGQVAVLKDRLKLKRHGSIERSVDSEKLEADLEMILGDDAPAQGTPEAK